MFTAIGLMLTGIALGFALRSFQWPELLGRAISPTIMLMLFALGVAVGVYFLLQPYVGTEEVGWMCSLAAAPFAACGFFSYHGMTAEQFLWAWVTSELLYPKKLVFRSDSIYYRALEPAIAAGSRPKKKRKNKEKRHGKNA